MKYNNPKNEIKPIGTMHVAVTGARMESGELKYIKFVDVMSQTSKLMLTCMHSLHRYH